MLIEMAVRNLGPFKDQCALSLRAASIDEHPGNVLESKCEDSGLLCSAFVIGPNASGKSVLLGSVATLRKALETGVEGMCDPFAFGGEGSPCEISAVFGKGFVPYAYTLSFDSQGVVSETLDQYATGRRSMVFSRVRDDYRFGKGLSKGRKTISDTVGSFSAYLPRAAEAGDQACMDVMSEISGIRTTGSEHFPEDLLDDGELRKTVLRAMRLCDFGVSDIRRGEEGIEVEYDFEGERHAMPLGRCSKGTLRALQVLSAVCEGLMEGSAVILDDMDDGLHPRVVRWIAEQFSEDRNPNGAQLVASTNDLTVLDLKSLVRRDQVYFTSRNGRDGSCRMARLTDFNGVRKDTDLQKAYLSWKFDALPKISSSEELLKR